MPAERRKPRPQLKTRTLVASVSDAPERKAQTSSSRNTSRQNLKLSDWLTVFAYIDTHPTLSQAEVVEYFATLKSGALVFTQPTLSRKLQERSDLERCAHDNPSALDSKRPRVVTRPDVEKALSIRVKHVEAEEEEVNGPMLKETATTEVEKPQVANAAANRTRLKICIPTRPMIPQLTSVEKDISEAILELQARNRIFGTPPTLDEFIEPKEELEDPDSTADVFEGGDKVIMAKVVREMAEQNGEVINVDSDDDDESGTPDIPRGEAINLCERLAEACLQHGDSDASSDLAIDLLAHLRRFRDFLRRKELIHAQQTTLDKFFTPQSQRSSEPTTST